MRHDFVLLFNVQSLMHQFLNLKRNTKNKKVFKAKKFLVYRLQGHKSFTMVKNKTDVHLWSLNLCTILGFPFWVFFDHKMRIVTSLGGTAAFNRH